MVNSEVYTDDYQQDRKNDRTNQSTLKDKITCWYFLAHIYIARLYLSSVSVMAYDQYSSKNDRRCITKHNYDDRLGECKH